MRALAGWKVRYKIGQIALAIFNPAGWAGCNHRENSSVLYPSQKLCAFLHNSKVGCRIGIEYLIYAKLFNCGYHFARNGCTHRYAELFSEGSPYSGSCLEHNIFIGVFNSVPNPCNMLFFGKCAGRTYADTLSAHNTSYVVKGFIVNSANACFKASALCLYNACLLNLLTYSHTAAAKYTFIVVTYYRGWLIVYLIVVVGALERYFGNIKLVCILL